MRIVHLKMYDRIEFKTNYRGAIKAILLTISNIFTDISFFYLSFKILNNIALFN